MENFEEMMEFLKQTIDRPSTATIDVVRDTQRYASVIKVSNEGIEAMKQLKEVTPPELHDKIDSKIRLFEDTAEASRKVFKALCEMLPICQRMDMARNENKEKLKELLERYDDE